MFDSAGIQSWVQRTYLDALERIAAPAEVAYWSERLAAGAPKTAVSQAIINSNESRAIEVNRLYHDVLDRDVDPAGLDFWLAEWGRSGTSDTVHAALLGSAEFFQRSGATSEGAIQGLYDEVLARTASASELNYWQGVVATAPLANVAIGFLQSNEYRASRVEYLYRDCLHRPADVESKQYWLSRLQQGIVIDQIKAAVVSGQEYAAMPYFSATMYGAIANDNLEDTQAIQRALDDAAASGNSLTYLPRGTFIVDGLEIRGDHQKFIGPGILKLKSASTANAALVVKGSYNTVVKVSIDGNSTGSPVGRGEGVRVVGTFGWLRDVTSSNTAVGLTENTFVVAGANNLIERCVSLNAGYAGFRHQGENNSFRKIRAENYVVSGFVHNGPGANLRIDGLFAKSSAPTAHEGLILDASHENQFVLDGAVLRNCEVFAPENFPGGMNAAKFANVTYLTIERSQFLHRGEHLTSMRIAEAVDHVYIRDCFFSRDLKFQTMSATGVNIPPKSVVLSKVQIGDGVHHTDYSIVYAEMQHLVIESSIMIGYTRAAIMWQSPVSEYVDVTVSNSKFVGYNALYTTFDVEQAGLGILDLNRLTWVGNSRSNAGGRGAQFMPS